MVATEATTVVEAVTSLPQEPVTEDDQAAGDGQPMRLEAPPATADEDRGKQRSTIAFPYYDLDEAVRVAKAIHGNAGIQGCELGQLSAWLHHDSAASGAFRVKLTAARLFGMVDVQGEHVILTDLGRRVVDARRERTARADAFLHVPLHRKLYDLFKNGVLPRDIALERDIETLGVSPKQKSRARQVFQRSAQQAGFFEHGKDRLVKPTDSVAIEAVVEPAPTTQQRPFPSETRPSELPFGGSNGGLPPNVPPPIAALLSELPPRGAKWSRTERKKWTELALASFEYLYKDPEA